MRGLWTQRLFLRAKAATSLHEDKQVHHYHDMYYSDGEKSGRKEESERKETVCLILLYLGTALGKFPLGFTLGVRCYGSANCLGNREDVWGLAVRNCFLRFLYK